AYAGMSDIDRSLNRTPDQVTERVAASLTASSVGMPSIERVALSQDGSRVFAVAGGPGPAEARERISVNINEAMQRPVEASTAQWQQANEQLALRHDIQQEQERLRATSGPSLA
ncbi:MAG: XVIPCD domain-containing protein, partial [Stenotrophomonas koreensis]